MTHEEISTLVDKLYTATGVGDFDLAETMLADDLVITEADTLPMGGVYRGKTALRELFIKVMGLMDVAGLERGPTMTGGDQAVSVVKFVFQDPNLAPAELCEWFRFHDGKVCEIKPYYYDPAQVVAACEAKAKCPLNPPLS
jgi:hypothetical protein